MLGKCILIAFCCTLYTPFGNTESIVEAGIGTEYGGLGSQIYFPIKSNNFDFYIAGGLFSYSTETGGELGAGAGTNYYLDQHSSIGIYGGVLAIDKITNHETLDYSTDTKFGGSINYRYRFLGKGNGGFVLGVSYNVHSEDHYPFVSLGYRF